MSYLLAARQCEIGELERLAQTSELVDVIGRFAHALQRERGISNIFLASAGERFADARPLQATECVSLQREAQACFELLQADAGQWRNGARLFHRIAVALHGLEQLPSLRARIAAQQLTPAEATAAFVRLIAGLLAVVFEAADSAGDPEVSRALVALFNFMQGKEYAGQERALGAVVFATGRIDTAAQREWRHLIEQQLHCLQVFADFAEPAVIEADHASQEHHTVIRIERMRRIAWSLGDRSADEGSTQAWYDCCTQRIDAMRTIEDLLARKLRCLCERKIAEARAAVRDQEAAWSSLSQASATTTTTTATAPLIGPQLERSILDLVQEQSRRLQAMGDELETVRAALNERKVVERAKGLLMAHRQLTEDEAYRSLRQMAMNQKRRIADVAQAVLGMAEMLGRSR